MIHVSVNNEKIELEDRISYYDLSKRFSFENGKMPFLVRANGTVKELRRFAKDGEDIKFLFYDEECVKNTYARTATFMTLKVIKEIYGTGTKVGLKFRMKNSYYFEIENKTISTEEVKTICEKLEELSKSAIPIRKETFAKVDAFKIIDEEKLEDVKLLFRYNYRPMINLRFIDDYARYINGEVLYDTSLVKYFKLVPYHIGFFLVLSNTDDEKDIQELSVGEKSFKTLNASTDWARKLDINSIGKLNSQIAKGRFDDLVVMTESFQDKQIGDIADIVKKSNKRIVFVAGPSSSGKTSFSHRLMYHLRALDMIPHPIACDNFFKERDETPLDEKGEYNFEDIVALDIKLLNDTLVGLLDGKEVEMPVYNFATGKKEFNGNKLKIDENEVIILEGIHCLNPALAPNVNPNDIFKIYISALTEVSIDNVNRIATSDLRLIRRMVRDSRTRAISPKETIKRWPSVRSGEEKFVFPYQENADIYFNSALIYEFSVLKNKALAKLYDLTEDEVVGETVRRLIKILNYFLGAEYDAIPRYSIIREFIGYSIMNVG